MGEQHNGNGVARFGGKPFVLLDGTEILVPEFNLDEAEAYIEVSEASIEAGRDATKQRRFVRDSIAVVHRAISRNHPDLTLQQLRDGLGFRTGQAALLALVNDVNGLVAVPLADPPAGDQPAT